MTIHVACSPRANREPCLQAISAWEPAMRVFVSEGPCEIDTGYDAWKRMRKSTIFCSVQRHQIMLLPYAGIWGFTSAFFGILATVYLWLEVALDEYPGCHVESEEAGLVRWYKQGAFPGAMYGSGKSVVKTWCIRHSRYRIQCKRISCISHQLCAAVFQYYGPHATNCGSFFSQTRQTQPCPAFFFLQKRQSFCVNEVSKASWLIAESQRAAWGWWEGAFQCLFLPSSAGKYFLPSCLLDPAMLFQQLPGIHPSLSPFFLC
jgi:hypothetical protein